MRRLTKLGIQWSLLNRLTLIAMVLCPALSRAEIPITAFESANKLYEQGKFAEAASAYASLLQSNQASAALYFNLGNAFFKSGQIGRAIAAYRYAGRVTPRDPDVRANLQFARNQRQGPTLSPNRWQRWLGRLTLNEWTLLAAVAVWLWLLLLTILRGGGVVREPLRAHSGCHHR